MPQVGAAIAAAATAFSTSAVGSFLLHTTVGKLLLSTGMSIALNAMATALGPNPGDQGNGGIARGETTAGSEYARSFILGTYATAAHAIAPQYVWDIDKDDNKYLTYILDLSDARIHGVEAWMIDGKEYKLRPQRNPGDAGYFFDDKLGQRIDDDDLSRHAFVRWHNGTQTQADPVLVEMFENYPNYPIDSTFTFTGVAYAVMTFKWSNKDPSFSSFPKVKAVVHGKPLYDPRKDSSVGGSGSHRWGNESTYEFTRNPIVMVYNLMRGITLAPGHVYGVGAKASELPLSYWMAAMNVCDEAGTEAGQSSWLKDRRRYEAGLEVSVDSEPLEVIREILKATGGVMAATGSAYTISVGSPSAAIAHFTDDDILRSTPASYVVCAGLNETINGVTAGYPSPENLWEEVEADPLFNAAWEAKDDGRRLVQNIKFPAVSNGRQVRRLMREMAADNRRERQHTIVLSPKYLGIEPTNTISWTSPINGYDAKLFEVVSKTVDSASLAVSLVLRERDPSDYDFDAVSDSRTPFVPNPSVTIPVLEGMRGFTAVGIVKNNGSGIPKSAGIRLSWSDEADYPNVAYEVRLNGTTDLSASGNVSDPTKNSYDIHGAIFPQTGYQVRAKAIFRNKRSNWSDWITVMTPAIVVTNADMSQEVLDELNDLNNWITNDGSAMFEDINQLRDQIDADIEGVTGAIATVRADLESDVHDIRQEAIINLGVAKSYTDTGITQAQNTIQGKLDSQSARIDQLTAALTSDNLITNGKFIDGTANDAADWVEIGTVSRIAKNTGSTDALIASMPEAWAVQLNSGNLHAVKQTISLDEYGPQDKLQFKFKAGSLGTTARTVAINIRWFNASSVEITPASTQSVSLLAGSIWRSSSGRFDIPAGARSAEIELRHTTATGQRILLTDVTFTLVNTEIEARISELEVAQANTTSTIATMESVIGARFEANEGAITLEASTRSDNEAATSIRIGGVEARTANTEAKILTIETSIANTNASIVAVEDKLSARFGVAELVRDPIFQDGITRWNHSGTLSNISFGAKDTANASWPISDCPAPSFLRINAGATGFITSQRFPVTAGEVFDVEFGYARVSNGVIPQLQYIFRNKSGAAVAAVNRKREPEAV